MAASEIRDTEHRAGRVYFAAADRQMEILISRPEAFERSLLVNTLFQNEIVIPDIFFFISQYLQRHVLGGTQQSLLASLIAQGVVRPALRYRDAESFREIVERLRRDGVQGMLPGAVPEEIATRLDGVRGGRPRVRMEPLYWPTDTSVGVHFGELAVQYLQGPLRIPDDLEEDDSEKLRRHWAGTAEWREGALTDALTAAVASGDPMRGLRRGDVMNAVGQRLGVRRRDDRGVVIDDSKRQLLPMLRTDPERQEGLRLFLLWMNECYHFNQASFFGSSTSFPSYSPIEGLMAARSGAADAPMSDSGDGNDAVLTIELAARIPVLPAIRSMRAEELLSLKQHLGDSYLTSVSNWDRQPTRTNANEVRRTFAAYAEALRIALPEVRTVGVKVSLGKSNRAVFKAGDEAAEAVSELWWPVWPVFKAIWHGGHAVYNLVSRRRKPSESLESVRLEHPRLSRSGTEVIVPPPERSDLH